MVARKSLEWFLERLLERLLERFLERFLKRLRLRRCVVECNALPWRCARPGCTAPATRTASDAPWTPAAGTGPPGWAPPPVGRASQILLVSSQDAVEFRVSTCVGGRVEHQYTMWWLKWRAPVHFCVDVTASKVHYVVDATVSTCTLRGGCRGEQCLPGPTWWRMSVCAHPLRRRLGIQSKRSVSDEGVSVSTKRVT